MNYVVESYENYKEEDRLTTNNARKIEFITTTRVLDEVIDAESKILDCAAGTGVYAFWLADKGHDVAVVKSVFFRPYLRINLFFCKDTPFVGRQKYKQIKFLAGQLHREILKRHGSIDFINHHIFQQHSGGLVPGHGI